MTDHANGCDAGGAEHGVHSGEKTEHHLHSHLGWCCFVTAAAVMTQRCISRAVSIKNACECFLTCATSKIGSGCSIAAQMLLDGLGGVPAAPRLPKRRTRRRNQAYQHNTTIEVDHK